MNQIQNLTSDALQTQTVILPDGTRMPITLQYVPMQYGWFLQSLSYGNFTLTGFRIFTSPNMLRQYQHQIAFGLACLTQDQGEPTQQTDFSTGYASLYVLTAAEVAQYEKFLSGGSSG
jgi:NAD-specific glutamate dehydrogenase